MVCIKSSQLSTLKLKYNDRILKEAECEMPLQEKRASISSERAQARNNKSFFCSLS